ncbi:hypothetical protein [Mycobacterium riyadhense]|uniref:Uncharacterized protein n=1 Tax=Mycobacterium riyadhense TaxID=486698 RepID=A0A653F2W7_9MYCO|nr:hypothetical protein [Mycobacterium riyadhense]VTP04095.1 hypothetical protein BIN_B_05403 [Mycobacterium riyadhense]
MGFWQTFKDFKPSTRFLLVVSLVIGVLFCAALWATDQNIDVKFASYDLKRPSFLQDYGHMWLNSHAYITNISAGFTGFLIGVPVAAVILATFTIDREDKAASDRVQALTRVAWNQYRDAILDLCGEDRISALEQKAQRIQEIHNETIVQFQEYDAHDNPRTEKDSANLIAFTKQQIPLWDKAFEDLEATFGSNYDLQLRWFAILRDWNTLDQFVRLQRLERGLNPPWFERELDSYLQQHMTADKYPMQEFFGVHEGVPKTDNSRKQTMWASYKSLLEIADQSHENLHMHLVLRTNLYFPNTPVKEYMGVVEHTVSSMRALANTIGAVEHSGWP